MTRLARQGQRVICFERLLPRIDLFDGLDFRVSKKLLRLSTSLSATPVIAPIDLFCHVESIEEKQGAAADESDRTGRQHCIANPQ